VRKTSTHYSENILFGPYFSVPGRFVFAKKAPQHYGSKVILQIACLNVDKTCQYNDTPKNTIDMAPLVYASSSDCHFKGSGEHTKFPNDAALVCVNALRRRCHCSDVRKSLEERRSCLRRCGVLQCRCWRESSRYCTFHFAIKFHEYFRTESLPVDCDGP
jgi:hypothetical protein